MAGDGIELTSVEQGAQFDIDGDGAADQTAFVQGDDAFLALDANGNGLIDSGRELFGDQDGHANGFEKLSSFDSNSDGKIDALDPIFSRLSLLSDLNGDGQVQAHEIISLAQAGIQSLQLVYQSIQAEDSKGNTATELASFERDDGSQGNLVDVNLGYVAG